MNTSNLITKWQDNWKLLCDMAYYRRDVRPHLFFQNEHYHQLYEMSKTSPDFELLTLEYTWKKYNDIRDRTGDPIEPYLVPEMQEVYVPRILFECPGVVSFFKNCFPNCALSYWEDDGAV